MGKKDVVFLQCSSCTHCTHGYCCVFKRPVDVRYNKCKNHSTLNPNAQVFKVDDRLEIIMKAEEQQNKKKIKTLYAEDNKLRKLIAADIKKEKQQNG